MRYTIDAKYYSGDDYSDSRLDIKGLSLLLNDLYKQDRSWIDNDTGEYHDWEVIDTNTITIITEKD